TAPVQLDDEARQALMAYPFPGNVRELKNLAEQISVLSTDKHVGKKELEKFIPSNTNAANRLPVLVHGNGESHEFNNERDILYKLFFDMKRDVTELKRLFFEVMQNPGLAHQNPNLMNQVKELQTHEIPAPVLVTSNLPSPQPMVVHHANEIHEHVEVEESLNIMDKEKELIIKALKKHRGKRKDAAMDLGISERTLYRKLKEYDIDQ
ncbi:MAG TPA: helix-turn-helix domain-containing protein, partial [Flavisolibacter sp.]